MLRVLMMLCFLFLFSGATQAEESSCAEDSQKIGAAGMPVTCCEGLKAMGGWPGGYQGDCALPPPPGGLSTCSNCGDGICSESNGENICNCAEDCRKDQGSKSVIPENQTAQYIIDHLDVTSFRSSLGPRREAGKTSFADYGFTPVEITDESAILEDAETGWRFKMKVLRRPDNQILICLEDQALNGGSYHTQNLFSVKAAGDALLTAELENSLPADCPDFAY